MVHRSSAEHVLKCVSLVRDSGSTRHGMDIRASPRTRYRRLPPRFGYLFQEARALRLPVRLGERDVRAALPHDIAPSRFRAIARDKLALVGLKTWRTTCLGALGGMKKRWPGPAIAAEPSYIFV